MGQSKPYVLGIDVGGTKIAAAAFDLQGNCLGKIASLPTMSKMKPTVTLLNIKRVAGQAATEGGVSGPPLAVGMGSTGPLDLINQRFLDKDCLPNLVGFEIGDFVRNEIGAPLYLENDAACFAFGEARQGAGRDQPVVVGITLGTGFGCGIVINGDVYSGASNNAGEVAYCPAGGSDYDTACSGLGVMSKYGAQGREEIDARGIGELAEQGDARALEAWSAYGSTVGDAIGTIAAVLDPSVVVLGGSVSSRLPLFRETLVARAKQILLGSAAERFRVEPSALDRAAGVTGAAELALTRHPF